jgi:phospholipid-translocating ATPase
LKARLSCEQPNTSLYTFVGNLNWPEVSPEPIPLGPSQLLLRGSSLKNTDYVYGLVVFTGHDSKIMMNQTDPPSKRSRIEKQLDYIIYFMFSLLFLMSLISALTFGAWMERNGEQMWYLDPGDTTMYFDPTRSSTGAFLQFLTSIVLYGESLHLGGFESPGRK